MDKYKYCALACMPDGSFNGDHTGSPKDAFAINDI